MASEKDAASAQKSGNSSPVSLYPRGGARPDSHLPGQPDAILARPQRIAGAGGAVQLEVFEGMWHALAAGESVIKRCYSSDRAQYQLRSY